MFGHIDYKMNSKLIFIYTSSVSLILLIASTSSAFIPYAPCEGKSLEPCRHHPSFPGSIMCENIHDINTFVKVLRCSRMMNLQEVFLVKSSIDYLPLYILDFCGFSFLNLNKVTMNKMLEGNEMIRLEQLHFDSVTINSPWTWEPLAVLTRLIRFSVANMLVEVLNGSLLNHLNENLQSFILTSTNTTVIADYALEKFKKLAYFSIQNNEVRDLRRNMFPRPSKIKFFYFGKNKITTLPENMFQDMPELRVVAVQGNLISELHEQTFRHIWNQLSYVLLEGNPLKCSCKMLWLTKRFAPDIFRGECYSPKAQFGKPLKDLQYSDFHCY